MALLPQTGYTAVTGIALPATRQLVWSVAATVQNTAYRRLLAGALWLCAPQSSRPGLELGGARQHPPRRALLAVAGLNLYWFWFWR